MQDKALEFFQRYWVDGLDKKLPVMVTFVAIILLTHTLANLTWRLVPQAELNDEMPMVQRPRAILPKPVDNNNTLQADTIAQWNLFGKVEVNQPKPLPVQNIEEAPPTKLNLKLKGLFASSNKNIARAIIADAKQQEDSYSIGDDVPGGAKVHDILADRVILERNGKYEALELPKDISPTDMNQDRRTSAARPGSIASRTPSPSSNSAQELDTTNMDNSTLLRTYRDALINNPQSVMGLIRAQPFSKDGKLQGYRISPGKDRQLLTRFGLRAGDVVTSVNGVAMDNPLKALEVLRDLSTAGQLTVNVERNGTPQSFSFPINE